MNVNVKGEVGKLTGEVKKSENNLAKRQIG
jgi:hypothetical protein